MFARDPPRWNMSFNQMRNTLTTLQTEASVGVLVKISKDRRSIGRLFYERGLIDGFGTDYRRRIRTSRPHSQQDAASVNGSLICDPGKNGSTDEGNDYSPAVRSQAVTPNQHMLLHVLKRKFSSMYHAFAFFDEGNEGVLTEKKLRQGTQKLLEDVYGDSLHSVDVTALANEVLGGNLEIGMADFSRFFQFGVETTATIDKLVSAPQEFNMEGNNESWIEQIGASDVTDGKSKSPAFTVPAMDVLPDRAISHNQRSSALQPEPSDEFQESQDYYSRSKNASQQFSFCSEERSFEESSISWKGEFITMLASALNAPESRFEIMDCEYGSIIFIIYPDFDDRRSSETLAFEMQAIFANPHNVFQSWDPDLLTGSTVTLLLRDSSDWNYTCSPCLGLRPSSCLSTPHRARGARLSLSRSQGRLTALGAQSRWRMLDCKVKIGQIGISGENLLERCGVDKYPCTLFQHKSGIVIELTHHSYGNFKFMAGEGPEIKGCSINGMLSDCPTSGIYRLKDSSADFTTSSDLCPTCAESDKNQSSAIGAVKDTSEANRRPPIPFKDNAIQSQFRAVTSRQIGRWRVCVGVPHILIFNECEPDAQLVLTPEGFVYCGAGHLATAVVTENKSDPVQLTLQVARTKLRLAPTMPSDSTELDHSRANNAPPKVTGGASNLDEQSLQESYCNTFMNHALEEHCSCTKKLRDFLTVENGLSVHEKVNRRALSIRVVGEHGQACTPGTGCSTELAVLFKGVEAIAKRSNRSDIIVRYFTRRPRHNPVDVLLYLIDCLNPLLPSREEPKATNVHCFESSEKKLRELMLELILQDRILILVLDGLHLAEQMAVGKLMSFLRGELQPWLYNIRRPGYVRVVFCGEGGYCFPSGVPISTVQLNGLDRKAREAVLRKKLGAYNKFLGSKHIADICNKADAWKFQYLVCAVEIIKDFWIYEQQTNECEQLPDTLIELYGVLLEKYEVSFGATTMQSVLVKLVSHNFVEAEDIANEFTKEDAPDVITAVCTLVQASPDTRILELCDTDLKMAIQSRYNGQENALRKQESELRLKASRQRDNFVQKASVMVFEGKIGANTGCRSLEEAISLAAEGDTLTLCREEYLLDTTFVIDRNLTLRADPEIGEVRISIRRGQPAFRVEAELFKNRFMNTSGDKAQKIVCLTMNGVRLRQYGFEAEEIPRCMHIGQFGHLSMTKCAISSEFGVGMVVNKQGKSVVQESVFSKCARACIFVQDGGQAELKSTKVIVNQYTDIPEVETRLHTLFLKFCNRSTNEKGTNDPKEMSPVKHKDLQMGQRAETLDLKEFAYLLRELNLFPAHMTRTDIAEAFSKAGSSELDWNGFKISLNALCVSFGINEIYGVEMTEAAALTRISKARKSNKSALWYHADGIVADGAGSHCQLHDVHICGAVQGCSVKGGAFIKVVKSRIERCGKSRLDAAGILASGQKSRAEVVDCDVHMSENYGILVKEGAACHLLTSAIHGSGRHGAMAIGRGSRLELASCNVFEVSGCGIRAGQEAHVTATECSISNCSDAGVLAWYLGTKVTLVRCTVSGNHRGICAENEGNVKLDGLENLRDSMVTTRKGNIESLDENRIPMTLTEKANESAESEMLVCNDSSDGEPSLPKSEAKLQDPDSSSNPHHDDAVRTLEKKICKKPEVLKVKKILAALFQNVAEASVFLDANGSGSISQVEIGRAFTRLGIQVDADKIFHELGFTQRSITDITIYDFLKHFRWHPEEKFVDGSWKSSLIDARRSRRRIMDKIYEKLRCEQPKKHDEGIERSHRVDRLSNRFKHLKTRHPDKSVDLAVKKSGEVVYIKAGHVYPSSRAAIAGEESLTRLPSSHGLPGVVKCFQSHEVRSKYLNMNSCTLSRYPRLLLSLPSAEQSNDSSAIVDKLS